jgi:hypothetical protein
VIVVREKISDLDFVFCIVEIKVNWLLKKFGRYLGDKGEFMHI